MGLKDAIWRWTAPKLDKEQDDYSATTLMVLRTQFMLAQTSARKACMHP